MMLSQVPPPSPPSQTQTQTWAAIITAVAGAVAAVFAKKRFGRAKNTASSPKASEPITRLEFHQALEAMRDRLEANHREILGILAQQAATVEKRLAALEAAVARLDERTRKSST